MEKLFRVYPDKGKYISGILPNGKRIEDVTDLPLNRIEFLRCKAMATVFALVGNPPKEINVQCDTYEDAMLLFDEMVNTLEKIDNTFSISNKDKVEDNKKVETIIEKETKSVEKNFDEIVTEEDSKETITDEELELNEEETITENEEIVEEEPLESEEKLDSSGKKENENKRYDNRLEPTSSNKDKGYQSFDKKRNSKNKK